MKYPICVTSKKHCKILLNLIKGKKGLRSFITGYKFEMMCIGKRKWEIFVEWDNLNDPDYLGMVGFFEGALLALLSDQAL